MQALEAESNIYVRGFFWLSLLTGCRKRELLNVRWSEIDLESGLLRLSATKNGRTHYVTLAAPVLLVQLPRAEGNHHVFVGRKEGEVPTIDQAWRRIRSAAGAPDAWLHDLRRTVGSWLAQSGVSLHLIGHVLNHSSPVVTSVYARLANESARAVLERHAEAVLSAVAGSDAPTNLASPSGET
jgi:integrase